MCCSLSIIPFGWKPRFKSVLIILNLILSAFVVHNASALTAETAMGNVLAVYEDIENYAARVHTYKADSMEVSGSVFERQPPRLTFNLFFRKPDEHAVQEIGNSGRGIFRIELLSTLTRLRNLEMQLRDSALLLGKECHVLECIDPEKPGDKALLWVSHQDLTVLQLSLFIKSFELARTRFIYADGNSGSPLPIETRTFFPESKQVLINRMMNYEINTGLTPEIFDKPRGE